jgi:hypothetical protein
MAGDILSKSGDDAGRLLPGIQIDFAHVTMAGFQVTLYGRFWVTPKDSQSAKMALKGGAQLRCRQEDQRAQVAYCGRIARQATDRGGAFGRHPGPGGSAGRADAVILPIRATSTRCLCEIFYRRSARRFNFAILRDYLSKKSPAFWEAL